MEPHVATSVPGATSYVAGGALPRLEAGDHLDQPTFHARYEAMPSSFRAELVEGMVIVPSPLGMPHGIHHSLITGWLILYQSRTPGVTVADNATTILSDENEFQPDALLVLDSACGGQSRVEGGYLVGPPELVVEVASSSESIDLHGKFRAYQAAGVREYVVVLLRDKSCKWFVLREGRYVEIAPDEGSVFKSPFFSGLWLDAAALLAGDAANLLAVLEAGLAAPEHARQAEEWGQRIAAAPRPETAAE